jgi:hypothetical protein
MKPKRGWQAHEKDIQGLLGLDSTICSGNKFYDPGDGVDRSHPTQNSFALIVDAKCTTAASFSLKLAFLKEWEEKAAGLGKRFAMPIRFEPLSDFDAKHDYVLLTLNDFAELLELARDRQ